MGVIMVVVLGVGVKVVYCESNIIRNNINVPIRNSIRRFDSGAIYRFPSRLEIGAYHVVPSPALDSRYHGNLAPERPANASARIVGQTSGYEMIIQNCNSKMMIGLAVACLTSLNAEHFKMTCSMCVFLWMLGSVTIYASVFLVRGMWRAGGRR